MHSGPEHRTGSYRFRPDAKKAPGGLVQAAERKNGPEHVCVLRAGKGGCLCSANGQDAAVGRQVEDGGLAEQLDFQPKIFALAVRGVLLGVLCLKVEGVALGRVHRGEVCPGDHAAATWRGCASRTAR